MNTLKLTSPHGKLVMWYKCRELFEKGLTKAQICRTIHLDKKTVSNFVQHIRTKYEISKTSEQSQRQYSQVEETEYGEYAQVDFGEMWMQYSDGRRKKVYFFVMILCRSRKKNHTPQTLQKVLRRVWIKICIMQRTL